MKVTAAGLFRVGALSAVIAGLLFVAIQFVHPPDELAAVTTSAWAIVHYLSLAMELLFIVGIGAIYAYQFDEAGWLGLVGLIALSLGLLLTSAGTAIEIFVLPLLASSEPGFVEAMLGLVSGHPTAYNLGALTTLWSLSGLLFVLGCLVFGVAMLRANVVSRVASAIFAFGLLLAAPVVAITGLYRLAALPIGVGLAWMGHSVWSDRRARRIKAPATPLRAQADEPAIA